VGTSAWRFGYTPTLRKVHADRKAALDPDSVERQLQEIVRQVFREKVQVGLCFYPNEPGAIPDTPAITLVVLPPGAEFRKALREQLANWTISSGQTPRQYPGALLWAVPEGGFGSRTAVEDWLAWQITARDAEQGLLGEIDPHDFQTLRTELRQAKDVVEERVWTVYNRLLLWNGKEGALKPVGLKQMHPSEAQSITGAILARLRQEGLLNREVGASYVERHWPPALKESGTWPLAGLRAAFFQGHLTRLEKAEDALRQMILRAVKHGIFGLGVGKDATQLDRVWFQEEVDPAEIVFDYETFLLIPSRAKIEKVRTAGEELPPGVVVRGQGPDFGQATATETASPEPESESEGGLEDVTPSVLQWRGHIPRDKWNLFGHRVLARLGSSENVMIEVTLRAKVEGPSVKQQIDVALQELGLEGELTEDS